MMRILIDTNVALTWLTRRADPFLAEADQILNMCANDQIEGAIALHSLSTIWYHARKLDPVKVRSWMRQICVLLTVCGADNAALLAALDRSSITDFEDAMQDCCAASFRADYIVTSNIKDFRGKSQITALTPREFLNIFVRNDSSVSCY